MWTFLCPKITFHSLSNKLEVNQKLNVFFLLSILEIIFFNSQQQLNMTPQTESNIYINIEKLSSVIDKRFLLKTLPISDIALSAGVLEA